MPSRKTAPTVSQDFKVLECPPELVAYLQSYKTLIIRGEDNDEAVICTDNSTYCLRQVETSNTMMLIKHLPQKRSLSPLSTRPLSNNQPSNAFTSCFPDTRIDAVSDIIFTHSNYLEVVRIPPKLDRLAMLLAKCPYGGPEEEQRRQSRSDVVSDDTGSIPVTVYAMADFLHEVQASEAEIRLYLDETGAIEIDGKHELY
ncbi:hypothetical protein BASA81_017499 [Batrachochytrium salamandrivorans]|nr:hypothetical protein BASA81_017499 [Batrachochytrium salamandrivorans]